MVAQSTPMSGHDAENRGCWQVAVILVRDFSAYRSDFQSVTAGARSRFEAADWAAVQRAAASRIRLYSDHRQRCFARLNDLVQSFSLADWQQTKCHFQSLIDGMPDEELAQTWYNTLYRKLKGRDSLQSNVAFIEQLTTTQVAPAPFELFHFTQAENLASLFEQILLSYPFEVPFANLERDVAAMSQSLSQHFDAQNGEKILATLLRSVFYRNKGAYLIGQIVLDEHVFPLAIALQHDRSEGLAVDAILWNENDLSRIFSFTRAYFMVDTARPQSIVQFLAALMPQKKTAELYSSLGFFKHGKTVFYADFNAHLKHTSDLFRRAEGTQGLVMAVFKLESYQVVFKVIRDQFPASKNVTKAQVRRAYHLVKTHDRVGRMADTHEFLELCLPTNRFSEEVLEELLTDCSDCVSLDDGLVRLQHVYIERLMTPLNLYLPQASPIDQSLVLEDYGLAIKQLAAANIFPGDMLPKNFGVTRHGRVVFYDYDEICYLTEINFRALPAADPSLNSAEPWFEVGEFDVFPEEFAHFLMANAALREIFGSKHGDLFTPDYWQGVQRQVEEQLMLDVFPYSSNRRLSKDPAR